MVQNYKTIPKVIHYFWFGGNPLPEVAKKCIKSWKKYCPDYEIKRWDESNFDINICDYVKEAYDAKKWAFVSDYARFYILNKYGGVYLDTDVELKKSLTPIIKTGPFFALETEKFDSIAPGLGMATYSNNTFYQQIIDNYNKDHYLYKNNLENKLPVGKRVTQFLIKDGLKDKSGLQKVDGFTIYPKEYFCPFDYFTGKMTITSNTVAIHLYSGSWLSNTDKQIHKVGQFFSRCFGRKAGERVEMLIRFPIMSIRKINEVGLILTIKYYKEKIKKNHNI